MAAGRSKGQKPAFVRDFTAALMRQCGAETANVNILFEDVELDHCLSAATWSLGETATPTRRSLVGYSELKAVD